MSTIGKLLQEEARDIDSSHLMSFQSPFIGGVPERRSSSQSSASGALVLSLHRARCCERPGHPGRGMVVIVEGSQLAVRLRPMQAGGFGNLAPLDLSLILTIVGS